MSDSNKSYKESLKEARWCFYVGIGSGITGLLFFIFMHVLGSTYFANINIDNNFANLNNTFTSVDKKLDDVKELLESDDNKTNIILNEIKNDLNEIKSANLQDSAKQLINIVETLLSDDNNSNDILDKLNYLEDEFSTLEIQIKRDLNTFNNNYFIIVSLLGGVFLEIIAVINFYQYGKVLAKDPENIDRDQIFRQLYILYNKSNESSEQKGIRDLMANIMPNKKFDYNDKEDSESEDRNGNDKSSGSKSATPK